MTMPEKSYRHHHPVQLRNKEPEGSSYLGRGNGETYASDAPNAQATSRNAIFNTKIARIETGANETFTPMEFVVYLLKNHEENGMLSPVKHGRFSTKIHPRPHYFSEAKHHNQLGTLLPKSLAIALANLTDTDLFFWQKPSYTLEDAATIHIDMERDIPKPAHLHASHSQTGGNETLFAKISGILYENQADKLAPTEFVQLLLDTHKENGLYTPITRHALCNRLGTERHYFTGLASDLAPGKPLPDNFAAALANLTGRTPDFWKHSTYTLDDARDIHIDMSKDPKMVLIDNPGHRRAVLARTSGTGLPTH